MSNVADNLILVTDNLLSSENEQHLRTEGFEVVRLAKHSAGEDELIEALQGKSGYILGGVEIVTKKVLNSARMLKAIVYTSSNYAVYIPAYELATRLGIAISNCPGADSSATAEYALTLMLAMIRNVFDVGRIGKVGESTGRSLHELSVGIVGLGQIGTNFAILLRGLGVNRVGYFSRTRRAALEDSLRLRFRPRDALLSESDVVAIFTPRSAGTVLGTLELARIPDGGVVINVAYPEAVDCAELIREIQNGRLRAAFDFPPDKHLDQAHRIPPGQFFWSNEYAGYNTTSVLRRIGDMATASMINLLTKGTDRHLVNPDYCQFRHDVTKNLVL